MKTGIVVNNYDSNHENRCQIRVYGVHTKTVGGKYVLIDDDLPWASPGPTGNGTSVSLPQVGETVYVDYMGPERLFYYGPVRTKGNVKQLIHANAEDSENIKISAYSENETYTENFMIYYVPSTGLVISANGNTIRVGKEEDIEVISKFGPTITLGGSAKPQDITIQTEGSVTVNSKEVILGEEAATALSKVTTDHIDGIIKQNRLIEKFNNHKHTCGIPDVQFHLDPKEDFNENIKIGVTTDKELKELKDKLKP